jgi:putative glycosyltransferase (TIGR04372 family)
MMARKALRSLLIGLAVVVVSILRLLSRLVTVRTFICNHKLFGHLCLEPEKYLAAKSSGLELYEIGFIGEKTPDNIVPILFPQSKTRWTIDLWSFGRPNSRSNNALVRMWKRELWVVPSFVVDVLLRANDRYKNPPIIDYRFSTLLSSDQYLDRSNAHLRLTKKENKTAEITLRDMGLQEGQQFVCLVVREGGEVEALSRNHSVHDFEAAALALAEAGIAVVRMGASNCTPMKVKHNLVFDYANSGRRSELADIYLMANCKFTVSTMSGPDALALAFRRPVLYIDVAHYGLVFSGTRLTTWVPARLKDIATSKILSLSEAFSRGVGWYWKDSQFAESAITIEKSTAEEITKYALGMLERTTLGGEVDLLMAQSKYQTEMASAIGNLGQRWHGPVVSRLAPQFLAENSEWFLDKNE